MYQKYIKRGLDFILSLSASIILSPVMLIVAILVRIKLGSPVLFKQPRPGKNEKVFGVCTGAVHGACAYSGHRTRG